MVTNTPFGETPPAEAYLIDEGLVARHTDARAAIVSYIGCRILTAYEGDGEPVVYARELQDCTGLPSGTVVPIMRGLERVRVLVSEVEEGDETALGRPLRRLHSIADSALGDGFRARLERPDSCPLAHRRGRAEDTDLSQFLAPAIQLRTQTMEPAVMAKVLGISPRQLLELERTGGFRVGMFGKYLRALGLTLEVEMPSGEIHEL